MPSGEDFLQRAYALSTVDGARDLYKEWAASYDKDLASQDYASPERAVEAVLANLKGGKSPITIMDAGCGTGLVGGCFTRSKVSDDFVIDGLDLSKDMLEVAQNKGIYRSLDVADLSGPITRPDQSYDVVTCVGTLTKGHVGPKVMREFARITLSGGLVVATVHDDIWETLGYRQEVESLSNQNVVEVLGISEFGISTSATNGARMIVLRKI